MSGIKNYRSFLFMEHYMSNLKRRSRKKYFATVVIVKGSLDKAFRIYKQCAAKVVQYSSTPAVNHKMLALWKEREDNWYRKYTALEKLLAGCI
jgi:hypothetical protein